MFFFFLPHSVCLVPVVIICIELEKGSCNLLIYQIKMNINNEYIMPAASEKSFFQYYWKTLTLERNKNKEHACV